MSFKPYFQNVTRVSETELHCFTTCADGFSVTAKRTGHDGFIVATFDGYRCELPTRARAELCDYFERVK